MLNSPKSHQVLALVTKICTAESKDTYEFDSAMADTNVATEYHQVWDTTLPT